MNNIESINELDQSVLSRIKFKVYTLERINEKNNKFNDTVMREKIRQIIKEEVNKCY